MEEKDKILEYAEEKFFADGFYKTTMDEVASNMRVSKKTIYKHFPSKDDLLKSLVSLFTSRVRKEIETIVEGDLHAVEKIVAVTYVMRKIGVKLSDKLMNDIRIHHPSMWKAIEDFRAQMISKNISKIFAQGVSEGYIIDVPPVIAINVFLSSVRAIINPDFIMNNSFSAKEAIEHTFRILINGLLTDKGREAYNNLISQKAQE